jgi:hypothetical protein
MTLFQGLFLLVLGIGVGLVALQGASRGWLPNGPNGFKEGTGVSRSEQPLMFWFFFSIYFAGAIAMTVYALRLLFGDAEPLPLN